MAESLVNMLDPEDIQDIGPLLEALSQNLRLKPDEYRLAGDLAAKYYCRAAGVPLRGRSTQLELYVPRWETDMTRLFGAPMNGWYRAMPSGCDYRAPSSGVTLAIRRWPHAYGDRPNWVYSPDLAVVLPLVVARAKTALSVPERKVETGPL